MSIIQLRKYIQTHRRVDRGLSPDVFAFASHSFLFFAWCVVAAAAAAAGAVVVVVVAVVVVVVVVVAAAAVAAAGVAAAGVAVVVGVAVGVGVVAVAEEGAVAAGGTERAQGIRSRTATQKARTTAAVLNRFFTETIRRPSDVLSAAASSATYKTCCP